MSTRLFSYGELIMVRNSDDEHWNYAYFARFSENGQFAYVFRNGASAFTQRTECGYQPHELSEEDLEGFGGLEFAFPCERYTLWQKPQHVALYKQSPMLSTISVDTMRRGDLVQIRYEDGEPWKFAHVDSFGEDGRIRVILNGCTPYTERNAYGFQRHNAGASEYDSSFNVNIYNFWRHPTEITDSSDLRLTDQYRKQWCLPEIQERLETN